MHDPIGDCELFLLALDIRAHLEGDELHIKHASRDLDLTITTTGTTVHLSYRTGRKACQFDAHDSATGILGAISAYVVLRARQARKPEIKKAWRDLDAKLRGESHVKS